VKRIAGPNAAPGSAFREGVDPTLVTAAWLNSLQEEVALVVEGAQITLDRDDDGQLATAIATLISLRLSLELGAVQYLVAPQAVSTGDRLLIGGLFVVALEAGDSGDVVQFLARSAGTGVAKASGVAFAPGQRVYWDPLTDEATDVAAGNHPIGFATAEAAGGAGNVNTRLDGVVLSPQEGGPLQASFGFQRYASPLAGDGATMRYVASTAGTVTLTVEREAGSAADASEIAFAAVGTAVAGIHYNVLTSSPIAFGAGQATAALQIEILDPALFHREKLLRLDLISASEGGVISTARPWFEVYIHEADPGSKVPSATFAAASSGPHPEDGGSITVAISLDAASAEDSLIHFEPDPAVTTAIAGAHYVLEQSPKVIPAGQTSATITVEPINGGLSGDVTLALMLRHEAGPVVQRNLVTESDLPFVSAALSFHEPEPPTRYGKPTVWIGGCRQGLAPPGYSTEPERDPGVLDPDGRKQASFLRMSTYTDAPGCLKPHFGSGIWSDGPESLPTVSEGSTAVLSCYVHEASAAARRFRYFRIGIMDRTRQIQTGDSSTAVAVARFEWLGAAPVLIEVQNGGVARISATEWMCTQHRNYIGNGWHRIAVEYTPDAGEGYGDRLLTWFLYPVDPEEGHVPADLDKGCCFFGVQFEVDPPGNTWSEYQEVLGTWWSPRGGLDLGAIGTHEMQLQDVDLEATVLEYDPIGSPPIAGMLAQAVVPIDPTSGALPQFGIDGQRADVFPVTRMHDGRVDAVQVVGPCDGSGSSLLLIGGAALPGTDQWDAVDLSGLTADCLIDGVAGTVSATLLSTQVEQIRDGRYIDEVLWFSRVVIPGGSPALGTDRVLGFWTFVTRRADLGVQLAVVALNDLFDPSVDNGDSVYEEHPEVNGHVHVEQILLGNLPSGYELVATYEDASMDAAALEFLVRETGETHLIAARQNLVRHYALVPAGTSAEAADLDRFGGYCYAASGPYSVHSRRWFGASRDYVPAYGPSYTRGDEMGRAAALQWAADQLADVSSAAVAGTASGGFARARTGWFHPYGPTGASAAGGTLIHLRHGTQFAPDEWRATRLQLDYSLQRHAIGITNPTTGRFVTAPELAAANGRAPGSMPFALYFNEGAYKRWFPHFVGADTQDSSNPSPNPLLLRPSARPWNTAALPVHEDVERVDIFLDNDENPYEAPHEARWSQCLYPLAYAANLGLAKWLLRRSAAHYEACLTPIDYGVHPTGAHIVNPFTAQSQGCAAIRQELIDAGREGWGGSQLSNEHFIQLYRGTGEYTVGIAEAARFEPDAARRAELLTWAEEMSLTADYILSDLGVGARMGTADGNLNHPTNVATWGMTELIAGGPAGRGAIPVAWSSAQLFHQSFSAWGFYALEVALRPRVNEPTSPRPAELVKYRSQVVDLIRHLCEAWESHPDAPAYPPAYVMATTVGVNPFTDPPDTTMRAWHHTWIGTPGSWSGYADQRTIPMLTVAYRLSIDLGLPGAGDFIRWAKVILDLPVSASFGELADRLEERMSSDVAPTSRNIHGYLASMLGEVQQFL
jgi:predicted RecA/RadA family phage recombinase